MDHLTPQNRGDCGIVFILSILFILSKLSLLSSRNRDRGRMKTG